MRSYNLPRIIRLSFTIIIVLCLTIIYVPSSNEAFAGNIPSKVSSLKASGISYNTISVTWKKPSNVSGYRLYRATSSKGRYTLIATPSASVTSYADVNITTGRAYYYKIRAYKSSGSRVFFGKYTSAVKAVAIPGKPQLLTVISEKPGVVNMTWSAVDSATGYAIYRRTSTGSYSKTGTTSESSYTDSTAVQGTEYYYYVRAYMTVKGRDVYSHKSSEKSITALSELSTPSIEATAYAKKINKITWNAVDEADGYEIYSRLSTNASYKKLATVTSNKYTDDKLLPRTKWYYKVRAYKTNSDGSHTYSAYSHVDNVVTEGHLVFISCGHGVDDKGRWDSGCCYGGYQEAKLMLPMHTQS